MPDPTPDRQTPMEHATKGALRIADGETERAIVSQWDGNYRAYHASVYRIADGSYVRTTGACKSVGRAIDAARVA